MREIVLDTETTGLDPVGGDRVVEIGCIELLNHFPTGRSFHAYLNPDRDMPASAQAVHGLSGAFLADKPRFADVAEAFLAFVGDARLIIHNAAFDFGFLNAELSRIGRPPLGIGRVVDTLAIARRKHPGAQNSLDALCKRYGVDCTKRTLHGALLDSELLAGVYIELIGGHQARLDLALIAGAGQGPALAGLAVARVRLVPLAPRLTPAETEAHAAFVAGLGPKAVWLRYPGGVATAA